MFDKNISVVNVIYNGRKNIYKVSNIKGFWSAEQSISINDTKLVKNDNVMVRILMSEPNYVEPKEFKNEGWTLRVDDYIVKGKIDKIESLTELKENYEAFKIKKIAKKDYGSYDMQHFEVSGE